MNSDSIFKHSNFINSFNLVIYNVGWRVLTYTLSSTQVPILGMWFVNFPNTRMVQTLRLARRWSTLWDLSWAQEILVWIWSPNLKMRIGTWWSKVTFIWPEISRIGSLWPNSSSNYKGFRFYGDQRDRKTWHFQEMKRSTWRYQKQWKRSVSSFTCKETWEYCSSHPLW
jgi:hypothetical protein